MICVFMIAVFFNPVFSEFSANPIERISGEVTKIQCADNERRHYTCFILEYLDTDYNLHKFVWKNVTGGKQNKIATKYPFKDIVAMTVNSIHTVYLIAKFSTSDENKSQYLLWMMKDHWSNFELIYKWTMHSKKKLSIAINNEDNLFLSADDGVIAFERNEALPIAVFHYSEKYEFRFFETSPKHKNVYFKVEDVHEKADFIYQIKKEEFSNIPRAELIPKVNNGDPNRKVTSMVMSNDEAGVFFMMRNVGLRPPLAYTTYWDKKKDELKLIHSQLNSKFHYFCKTSSRIYFTYEGSYIHFIQFQLRNWYVRNGVYGVEKVFRDLSIDKNKCVENNGAVFFPSENIILTVKDNHKSAVEMPTPSDQKISSILFDEDDRLWALGKDLYYFSNGSLEAKTISGLLLDKNSVMVETKYEGLYVGTRKGLFAVQKKAEP